MLALDDLVPAGWIITHVIAINDQEETSQQRVT
jgi:hypothetical protein